MNDKIDVKGLQKLLDELRTYPHFAIFVEQRKLHLYDAKLGIIDVLLKEGILK